ncbi:uncharacterized protein LTR77_008243 [Saxophila tyrrhenica]|uniref:Uncharacterized protein n=1 Tax=Saxophila tyrrhenica TaxID=1690608 RepID=A0AAV9P2W4_9PEZI|nr:hypothetical protein LTR77_008243 [Saxophila tyrrhenica]
MNEFLLSEVCTHLRAALKPVWSHTQQAVRRCQNPERPDCRVQRATGGVQSLTLSLPLSGSENQSVGKLINDKATVPVAPEKDCEVCGGKSVIHSEVTRLASAGDEEPSKLLVVLGRWNETGGKIRSRVTVPENLVAVAGLGRLYYVNYVAVHEGASVGYSHYYCYTRGSPAEHAERERNKPPEAPLTDDERAFRETARVKEYLLLREEKYNETAASAYNTWTKREDGRMEYGLPFTQIQARPLCLRMLNFLQSGLGDQVKWPPDRKRALDALLRVLKDILNNFLGELVDFGTDNDANDVRPPLSWYAFTSWFDCDVASSSLSSGDPLTWPEPDYLRTCIISELVHLLPEPSMYEKYDRDDAKNLYLELFEHDSVVEATRQAAEACIKWQTEQRYERNCERFADNVQQHLKELKADKASRLAKQKEKERVAEEKRKQAEQKVQVLRQEDAVGDRRVAQHGMLGAPPARDEGVTPHQKRTARALELPPVIE